MARRKAHEEHLNHEAWAIPYGDLITLLLAFFVVMYAVSSVNEGKYRVLADSLSQAFGGPPKSIKPIQIGSKPEEGAATDTVFTATRLNGFESTQPPQRIPGIHQPQRDAGAQRSVAEQRQVEALQRMSDAVVEAMGDLIRTRAIIVRRSEQWLEIEISTDILFASGVASVGADARPVLEQLAGILGPFPNPIRIEGHTDDRPIATAAFPSNWELSAARAASVVHLFTASGVDPLRMTVIGLGEYRPVASNADAQGRNRNRRVVIVVVAHPDDAAPQPATVTAPAGTVVVPAGTLAGLGGGPS